MYPNSCTGCPQAAMWPSLNYFAYPAGDFFHFSRKTQSFRISDILHPNAASTVPLALCPAKTVPDSALGPLQAFCTVKRVQNFVAQPSVRPISPVRQDAENNNVKDLKFGINRILSEEFGKDSHEKG